MVMIRPRGKASRIYQDIFSLESSDVKKEKEMPDKIVSTSDTRMNDLISRDFSLNTRPRNP